MTDEELKQAIANLPPDEQAKFDAWYRDFIAARFGLDAYVATPSELAGIERGLRDAAEGKFATDDQVEAVFAKHRPKP
jgi:predicted transcriptional regulator